MNNKKHHPRNRNYPVPQLRVASINFFPKEVETESDEQHDGSKSPRPQDENKRTADPPDFYEARIKPKNFDPL